MCLTFLTGYIIDTLCFDSWMIISPHEDVRTIIFIVVGFTIINTNSSILFKHLHACSGLNIGLEHLDILVIPPDESWLWSEQSPGDEETLGVLTLTADLEPQVGEGCQHLGCTLTGEHLLTWEWFRGE